MFRTWLLRPVLTILKEIAMNQSEAIEALNEANAQLQAVGTQLDKSHAEIVGKIQDLEDAIANGGTTTPEMDAAIVALRASADSLKTKGQTMDDVVADAPAPAPEEPQA